MGKGSKMQSVSFQDVEEFLEYLPEKERIIVETLRGLIFDCIPGTHEKLSYNVPFYRKNKNICFIWPASVLWGTKKTYAGVRLGFNQAFRMDDPLNYLSKGDRKQIYYHDFLSIHDIDHAILKLYLFEAHRVDQL